MACHKMQIMLTILSILIFFELRADVSVDALFPTVGVNHQAQITGASLINPITLGVLPGLLPLLSGWPFLGQNAPLSNERHTLNELPANVISDFGTLSQYLIPDDIDLDQRYLSGLKLEQLNQKEQRQLFESTEPDSMKPIKIYLTMLSGQIRAMFIQPESSDTHINKRLSAFLDSLLRLFIPLLWLDSIRELSEVPAPQSTLLAASGGSGDDDDNGAHRVKFFYGVSGSPSKFHPQPYPGPLEQVIWKKLRLLEGIWKRLQQAIANGNRNLALILRDRLIVIYADMDDLASLLSLEILTGSSQLESARNIQIFTEAQQLMEWINSLDSATAPQFPNNQIATKQSPTSKEDKTGPHPSEASGKAASQPTPDSNHKKRLYRTDEGSKDQGGDKEQETVADDSGSSMTHSKNHESCPLCETEICLECDCQSCQDSHIRDRATRTTFLAANTPAPPNKKNEIVVTVSALVTGAHSHEELPHDGVTTITQTSKILKTSEAAKSDSALSKSTKKAVKSIKSRIRSAFELGNHSEEFFHRLSRSDPDFNTVGSFESAWSKADKKEFLTLKNIFRTLVFFEESGLINELLPLLNLDNESIIHFNLWAMCPDGEPPDLFFDESIDDSIDDSIGNDSEQLSTSSTEQDVMPTKQAFPPLLSVDELRERETAPDARPSAHFTLPPARKFVHPAIKLLKEKKTEKAEASFRSEYEVDEQSERDRAHSAISLIAFYFPEIDDTTSAQDLYSDLSYKLFCEKGENARATEMDLLLIEKIVSSVSSVSGLMTRLAELRGQADVIGSSKIHPVMERSASLIKDFCYDLKIDSSGGRSLLDALAWGTGLPAGELLNNFIAELARIFFTEDSQDLKGKMLTMEKQSSDNYSPLLTTIFKLKFPFRANSVIARLNFHHVTTIFKKTANEDDIRTFFWQRLWKDEKEGLLSVLATAGHIRQALVVIYPCKSSFLSALDTIKGFAMDADMNFITDFDHNGLKTVLKRFSSPPLLLFRINHQWLAAIGNDLEAYSELPLVCREFYRVQNLQSGIHIHLKNKTPSQLPDARLMFCHHGGHSSAILAAKQKEITPEMYRLFLIFNDFYISNTEMHDFEALVEANNPIKKQAELKSSQYSTALATIAASPQTLIDIDPSTVNRVLSQVDTAWFKHSEKQAVVCYPSDTPTNLISTPAALSATDKLAEALKSLSAERPDLDFVMSTLEEVEIIYSEFSQSSGFEEDSVIKDFDLIYQQALSHPMIRLRQLSLSSWADIMTGFIYIEQVMIKQQNIPKVDYQNEELEQLQTRLLALDPNKLVDNQQALIHFIELFTQALPDIQAARFSRLTTKIKKLFIGKEKNLRLLQICFNQFKREAKPEALLDNPQTLPVEVEPFTEKSVSEKTDSSHKKALIMQEFFAKRGYTSNALLTDQQLLELSESLGMSDLLRILTEKQFQPERHQAAIETMTESSFRSDDSPEFGSRDQPLAIGGKTISAQELKALAPMELSCQGKNQLVYQTDPQTYLQVIPSQPMALLMAGRITPAELAHSSKPLRAALIKKRLETVNLQSRTTLLGEIRERLTSREISLLPPVAGVKGLKKLPQPDRDYSRLLAKPPKKAVKALPGPVRLNPEEYEEACTDSGYM